MDVIEFTMRANESCFDEFEFRKTLMKVLKLNYADILVEGAIECRLAHMNVFSHYCLNVNASGCKFSLNEQQKVYHLYLSKRANCMLFS